MTIDTQHRIAAALAGEIPACREKRHVGATRMTCLRPPHPDRPDSHHFAAELDGMTYDHPIGPSSPGEAYSPRGGLP